jgi:hypothetical protein
LFPIKTSCFDGNALAHVVSTDKARASLTDIGNTLSGIEGRLLTIRQGTCQNKGLCP